MNLHVLPNTLKDNLKKLEEIIMFVEFEVGDRVFHRRLNQEGTVVQVKSTFCVVKLDDGKEVSPHKVEIVKVRGKDEYNPVVDLAEFHKAFKYKRSEEPVALSAEDVFKRIVFIQEELIELLASSVDSEDELFDYMHDLDMHKHEAVKKELPKVSHKEELDRIIAQSDALVDILYFTYGTSDIASVDLRPLFKIVQTANMSKLDDNGEPIYNEFGKIQKSKNFRKPEPFIEEEIKKQIKEAEDNA